MSVSDPCIHGSMVGCCYSCKLVLENIALERENKEIASLRAELERVRNERDEQRIKAKNESVVAESLRQSADELYLKLKAANRAIDRIRDILAVLHVRAIESGRSCPECCGFLGSLSLINKGLAIQPIEMESLRPAESAERGKHIPECVAFVDPFSECVCGASLPEGRAGKENS